MERKLKATEIINLKKNSILFILFAAILLFIILGSSIHILANGSDNCPFNKYYTSIQVEDGDTLWSIADKYIGENSVDKESYVNDICRMNNLTDGQIHSGEYIIVAYYSHDIK